MSAILSSIDSLIGNRTFDILGDHTGAVIALHMAVYNKERVSKLILNGIPCFDEKERTERLNNAKYNGPKEDGEHLYKRWKSVKMLSGSDADNKTIERNFVEALRGGPFAHWGHRAVFSYKLLDILHKVDQPTLVFCPRDGLESRTEKYFTKLIQGTLKDLPDEDYGFLEYKYKKYADDIINFLDKN